MDIPRKSGSISNSPSQTDRGVGKKHFRRSDTFLQIFVPFLLRHRQATVVGVVILILLAEVAEHMIILRWGVQTHQIFDAVFYTLLVPPLTWLLLTLLERSETARKQANINSTLQMEFSEQLNNTSTWEELVQVIAAYPQAIVPEAEVTLFVLNPRTGSMQPEAACKRGGDRILKPAFSINPDTLPVGSLSQLLLQNGSLKDPSASVLPPHRYDLPITRNDQQIGVIKIEFPTGMVLEPSQIQALKNSTPLIALALESAILQNLAAEQAAASEANRTEIAQNLHDTLAQNIGLLRMKLDQLTGENTIRQIGAVLNELERMRAIADEAYQQVRNTLDELHPVFNGDLVTMINNQALAASERAGFTLRMHQTGSPVTMPDATYQQILYIAREALNNIEKHAKAQQVKVQFVWLESEMILKICDDGIGFNPLSIPAEGHYGLWIMQQRAMDAGGTVRINRLAEGGTEVTLWVPYHSKRTGG